LRDGLAFANRKGEIAIGLAVQRIIDKHVPWNGLHGTDNVWISYSSGEQLFLY
jgi:hypothetical protein